MNPLLLKAIEEGEKAGHKAIIEAHVAALRYSARLAIRSGVVREVYLRDMNDIAAMVWEAEQP